MSDALQAALADEQRCAGCGEDRTHEAAPHDLVCAACLRLVGHVLAKAMVDDFDYLVVLRDGTRVRFGCARWQRGDEWVRLTDITSACDVHGSGLLDYQNLERGVQVRLADIVLAVDAPQGS
jgi:hypothetical protein